MVKNIHLSILENLFKFSINLEIYLF